MTVLCGVLFDWDGTLMDTEPVTTACWTEVLSDQGIPLAQSDVRRLFFRGWPDAYDWLARRFELAPMAVIGSAMTSARARRRLDVRLFDDARPCLRDLRAAGIRVGMVTNSSRSRVLFDLSTVGLALSAFDVIVTADDVVKPKPSPDGYRAAIEALGLVPGDCIAVEDTCHGVTAAARAGVNVLHIDRSQRAGPPGRGTVGRVKRLHAEDLISMMKRADPP